MTRPRDSLRLPLLAGWLFADLMLLLFVIGLSFAPAESAPVKASPSPAVSPTPTVSPTPPVMPKERVLDQQYYEFSVNVSLADLQPGNSGNAAAQQLIKATDAQISELIAEHPALKGNPVGVAVIFGAGPIDAIGAATEEAGTAGAILHSADPEFGQASFLPEWIENDTPTFAKLIVFFYAS